MYVYTYVSCVLRGSVENMWTSFLLHGKYKVAAVRNRERLTPVIQQQECLLEFAEIWQLRYCKVGNCPTLTGSDEANRR